ncbi:hypothetical protein D1006_31965 [Burkholderia stabilis]|uniref:Uncharacterized protein n=1 Tax=Burkholderia stabilis TaxID=95485 RepID=A0A4Q2AI09_9BURK|nr:hypothetical protein D1006_31965 [Burkholderia stabilis]
MKFIACPSTIDDPLAARPIVARCGCSGPDAGQGCTRRAPPAGMRENNRRAGLGGPSALDTRTMRTTLEYGCGRPVCLPFRMRGFRPAGTRGTR